MSHGDVERVLGEINAMTGVLGSFVCDEDGRTLAAALPEVYDEELLNSAGRIAAQTTAGLWMARQSRVGDLDLLFAEGRLIIKSLDRACLCILSVPRLNLPLLNLTANVAVMKLQKAISAAHLRAAAPPKRERLQAAAEKVLGDHARKVVDLFAAAKSETPRELQEIRDEAVRFTGFFISREKAEELGRELSAIIAE